MSQPPDDDTELQRAPLSADEAPEAFEPAATDLDDALRPHSPGRVRVAQVVTLVIVLATLGGLLLRSGALTFNRPQPTTAVAPTPTFDINGPIVLLSNVANGTITLNGAPLAGTTPLVTTFKRGLNTLTLSAPPFAPRVCHIQWPSRQSDGSCFLSTSSDLPQSFAGEIVTPALIVSLPALYESLPSASQAQTLAATTRALQSVAPQITIAAGEYYAIGQDANGNIISHRATAPLQARLLAVTTGFAYFGDLFLNGAGSGVPGNQLAWRAAAVLQFHWQFSAGSAALGASAEWPAQLPESVVMTYDAQHGWSLDQDFTQRLAGYGLVDGLARDLCDVEIDALDTLAQQAYEITTAQNHQLKGCEFDALTAAGAKAGRFIYRFGVLLAADAQSHALLPDLPMAPATALADFGA